MFLVELKEKEPTYSLVLQKHIPLHINFLYPNSRHLAQILCIDLYFPVQIVSVKTKDKVVSHSKAAALFPLSVTGDVGAIFHPLQPENNQSRLQLCLCSLLTLSQKAIHSVRKNIFPLNKLSSLKSNILF